MEENRVAERINDIPGDNLKKLADIFPSVVKDGEVDFEALKEELGQFEEVSSEKYELTWAGKKEAKKLAQEDIVGRTLKFCPEESVNPDTTENLYIEGDNLEVLKLLRQNYYGAIKMIYIDPPYNTGNDFLYNDSFVMDEDEYNNAENLQDDYGNRFTINTKSDNRYHAKWLSMIYPRLRIARDLLTDDGVIFISIDETEIENLKQICNEVFGKNNSLGTFIWRKKDGGGQAKEDFVIEHEYILVYRKSDELLWTDIEEERKESEYNKEDARGKFKITKIAKWGNTARREDRPTMYFPIIAPDGSKCYPIAPDGGDGRWRMGLPKIQDLEKEELIYWTKKDEKWIPYEKEYHDNQKKIIKERSILYNIANTGDGSNVLTDLFGRKDSFENPKPIEIIEKFIRATTDSGDIILDFFSGSATTAHATLKMNIEENKKRRFIMIQLPELCREGTVAYGLGFRNICELGRNRIIKAGEKLQKNNPDYCLDYGYKTLKAADTNIKWNTLLNVGQIDLTQMEASPDTMDFMPGAKDIDVVYEIMLRQRDIPLSESVSLLKDIGDRTYLYADSYLICLETDISTEMVDKIAAIDPTPVKFIFRDSAFKDDIALKDETFRRLKAVVEKNSGEAKTTYTVEFI